MNTLMLAYSDALTGFGLAATAIGTLVGAWALYQAKKTENRAATREEVDQAFEMQGAMLEQYRRDNDRLRGRNDELHDSVNRLVGQLAEMKVKHERCEKDTNALGDRLRIAEARILELGG